MFQTFKEPTLEQVRSLLGAIVGRQIVVVGDLMLDAYLFGTIEKISPEAPVPLVGIEDERFMLGGAANVAKCLAALGAKATLIGVVGGDNHAELLRAEAANLGLDQSGLVIDPTRPTTLKSRVVSQQRQMLRFDREQRHPVGPEIEKQLIQCIQESLPNAEAIILCDFGKGVLTPAVCRSAIEQAKATNTLSMVDAGDPPWACYRGASILKSNRSRTAQVFGQSIDSDNRGHQAACSMLGQFELEHVLITRGPEGITLATACAEQPQVIHLPSHPRGVFDPTGAGDIVAAVLVASGAAGSDLSTAAYVANVAGSIEVSKFAASVVSESEILDVLGAGTLRCQRKILTRQKAVELAEEFRVQGKKVVFTNGCFDILHVGHVHYLERSRQKGDALIVGINTDASVTRVKGPGRPIQNEVDRAQLVAAQACVDAVVLFDDKTPVELIKAVRPDVLTKGSDYQHKQQVVGWELVEAYGGQIELIKGVEGRSTTKVLEKVNL